MKQVPANENNYSVGRSGHTIKTITCHWIVGTLASADATFQNPTRKASAHYGIEDGEIHQYVQEKDTAWHASNLTVNRESIGIEHSGGELQSDGTRRKPSEATHQTSGKLIGEICKRYNIPIDAEHILPHNKYSSTQCPGTLDIPLLINIAKGEQTMSKLLEFLDRPTEEEAIAALADHLGMTDNKCDWGSADGNKGGYLGSTRRKASKLQADLTECLNKPITPEPGLPDNLKLNGVQKTYVKDGVTISENYAVEE